MLEWKRDWLDGTGLIYWMFVLLNLFFLLLGFIFYQLSVDLYFVIEWYDNVFYMTNILLMIYPLYVFKMLAPKFGNFFDAKAMTQHLPITKKQLFWNGLKPWTLSFPLYLIGSIIVYYLLNVQFAKGTVEDFCLQLLDGIMVLPIMLVLEVQLLSALIERLVRKTKWRLLSALIVVGNLGYLLIAFILSMTFAFNFLGILALLIAPILMSGFIFYRKFNDIEKIYQ